VPFVTKGTDGKNIHPIYKNPAGFRERPACPDVVGQGNEVERVKTCEVCGIPLQRPTTLTRNVRARRGRPCLTAAAAAEIGRFRSPMPQLGGQKVRPYEFANFSTASIGESRRSARSRITSA
jgi:hypothetical protein